MATTQQLVTGVDFIGLPTHDLETAVEFYGNTLGLHRSVYLRERNYSEFETGNLTLSVYDAEAMGLKHSTNGNAVALHVEDVAGGAGRTRGTRGCSSPPRRWIQASATWRSSPTPTETRSCSTTAMRRGRRRPDRGSGAVPTRAGSRPAEAAPRRAGAGENPQAPRFGGRFRPDTPRLRRRRGNQRRLPV